MSEPDTPANDAQPAPNVFIVAPCLLVDDVVASAEHYRDKLGFTVGPYAREVKDGPPYFAMVGREGHWVQLKRAPSGHSPSNRAHVADAWDVYVFVHDLAALESEFRERGARILRGPEDMIHRMRELEVADRDGYVVIFGQPIHKSHEEKAAAEATGSAPDA